MNAPILLIEGGELYAPTPSGIQSVLIAGGTIIKVGEIDRSHLDALGMEIETIDARDAIVTPGLIDTHQHLLGGSGERGFSTQTPEIHLSEVIAAGVTTVVGCLGVDTTMKTMAGLLAKAKGLKEEGLTAYIYSGGYNVPPTTILQSIREDIMFVEEVVGAGEIAIADERCMETTPHELARLVSDAHIGGMLSGKAGITHFHLGPGDQRMKLLKTLLADHNIAPEWIYPTHIGRSKKLIDDGITLARRGATVDIDTSDCRLARWLRLYLDRGGDPARLTISSDASITSPATRLEQIRDCIHNHGFTLEQILPLVTANAARVLALPKKGTIEAGNDADLMVLRKDSLDLLHLISRGRRMIADGQIIVRERFRQGSNR